MDNLKDSLKDLKTYMESPYDLESCRNAIKGLININIQIVEKLNELGKSNKLAHVEIEATARRILV